MLRSGRNVVRLFALSLVVLVVGTSSGCVGVMAQLLYFTKGENVAAEFNELKGKRVAVVCVANTSAYDPGSASAMLAHTVEAILRQKVEGIKMVQQDAISNWIDNNNSDQTDYRDIGRGVNAQMVIGIDLDGLQLHEDATLYKGRANVRVTVFDMTKGGEAVFRRELTNFTFPENGGQHVSETNDNKFQRDFVRILAVDVAKSFHEYELKEQFARDSALFGH